MIKARHKKVYDWFFKQYSRYMIFHHFNDVIIKNNSVIDNKAVLLIGNHFSWWDGFIAKYLNETILKKVFHVMMLEEELKNRMFLNKAGAFSIMKSNRSMLETMQYTRNLLSYKENLVTIYPQGKFFSIYQQPIHFEKGLLKQIMKGHVDFQIVFYVALVDYFENQKPTLTIGLQKVDPKNCEAEIIEKEFNNYYSSLIAEQKQR